MPEHPTPIFSSQSNSTVDSADLTTAEKYTPLVDDGCRPTYFGGIDSPPARSIMRWIRWKDFYNV
jgi:hypothetical protein